MPLQGQTLGFTFMTLITSSSCFVHILVKYVIVKLKGKKNHPLKLNSMETICQTVILS